jgi:hypothetical protein
MDVAEQVHSLSGQRRSQTTGSAGLVADIADVSAALQEQLSILQVRYSETGSKHKCPDHEKLSLNFSFVEQMKSNKRLLVVRWQDIMKYFSAIMPHQGVHCQRPIKAEQWRVPSISNLKRQACICYYQCHIFCNNAAIAIPTSVCHADENAMYE